MGSIGAQASTDGLAIQGALRIVYSVIKDSVPVLADDAFTQANPSVVTAAAALSTTLPANVKRGVLGASVAFIRPDIGENTVGGATQVGAAYVDDTRPLGLFINDALGNENENTPGVGSGKGPFLRGGTVGVRIYETQVQVTGAWGTQGDALTYTVGQKLYASVNGLLTNLWQDSYERQWIEAGSLGSGTAGACLEPDCTRIGTVLSPPDAASSEMFLVLNLL